MYFFFLLKWSYIILTLKKLAALLFTLHNMYPFLQLTYYSVTFLLVCYKFTSPNALLACGSLSLGISSNFTSFFSRKLYFYFRFLFYLLIFYSERHKSTLKRKYSFKIQTGHWVTALLVEPLSH
jgi:hypothetical protein